MKRSKLFRALLIVLAVVLLAGIGLTAFASSLTGDLDGDGRITAFDAQILAEYRVGNRQLEDESAAPAELTVASILETIWGGKPACTDSDGDGVYEIYTAQGLFYMANHPRKNYILMNDIDLSGYNWVPVKGLRGCFDGNGKTISNVNITTSVPTYSNAYSKKFNLGFFGDTVLGAEVKNLNLRNVTVTASEETQYIGLVVASTRCDVTNCTVTGTIIDNRESHSTASGEGTFIGVLTGRICDPSEGNAAGNVVGGTSLGVIDTLGDTETTGLCADVKLVIPDKANVNVLKGVSHKIGLSGYTTSGATVSGIWSDSSNSSTLLSSDIQARQAKIVNYMNTMSTVEWTPSEDLVYTSHNHTDQTYKADVTYKGLPYNQRNGSYERFLSVVEQQENGVYKTVDGVVSGGYDATSQTWSEDGFYLTMGNDCSSAVGWAWMQVSNVMISDVSGHNTPYKGGAFVDSTATMIPTTANRAKYGIYPVGSWEASTTVDGKWVSAEFDSSKAAYQCTDQTYSPTVLQANGKDTILEAYAQTRKADALVCYVESWSENNPGAGGHARLVTTDPVIIRNADGIIDANASYLLFTEQGARFNFSTVASTWNTNKKISLEELSGVTGDEAVTSSSKTYLPITMRALRDKKLVNTWLAVNPADSITDPVSGGFYTYNRINSVTVTVTDADGKVYYDHEAFTGISANRDIYRGKHNEVTMEQLHGETFPAAAEANGMVDGTEYNFTVDVLLSTGESRRMVESTFTYTAPVDTESSESTEATE